MAAETSNIRKYIINTFWLFFDQIINIGLLAGTNILVTRYLGKENYGVIGYANSFISIFSVIACLGLDSIIVKRLITDNENKAKKSSEDVDEIVTETLARIYTEQMLYPKAINVYKKLMLKFPEKSRYFASQIEELEKRTN